MICFLLKDYLLSFHQKIAKLHIHIKPSLLMKGYGENIQGGYSTILCPPTMNSYCLRNLFNNIYVCKYYFAGVISVDSQ